MTNFASGYKIIFLSILLSLLILPRQKGFAFDIEHSDVAVRFNRPDVTPIEGIWLWNSGALVSIESDSRGNLTVSLIDIPDPLIETPIVIGSGKFGGHENTYVFELTAKIDATPRSGKLKKLTKFIAKLENGRRLSLSPYSTGYKINLLRLLPYLFRIGVTKNDSPDGVNAAIRVYPLTPSPEFPVIL